MFIFVDRHGFIGRKYEIMINTKWLEKLAKFGSIYTGPACRMYSTCIMLKLSDFFWKFHKTIIKAHNGVTEEKNTAQETNLANFGVCLTWYTVPWVSNWMF